MIDLRRMRWLIKHVPNMQWEIQRKTADVTRITTTLTGMPRGGGTRSRVEDGAITLAAVKDAYREVIVELETMRAELEPLINQLEDPDEKGMMRLRYMEGNKPEDIAETMHRSARGVYYYLRRGENNVRRLYEQQEKREWRRERACGDPSPGGNHGAEE